MKGTGLLLAFSLLAGSALAKPVKQRSGFAVKDTHYVPRKWTQVGYPEADHTISLRIGLKQGSFSELERHLYEVSDPDHSRWGKHLKSHEVASLLEPADETFDLVHEWLADNGIATDGLRYSPAKDWITVAVPVEQVEQMLDTKYAVYRHEDGTELVRTPKWSLPAHLHDHIDTIQPTNSWFRAKPKAVGPAMEYYTDANVSDVCVSDAVTPTCIRTLYGTIDYQVQAADKNSMGLCDFLNETNNRNDTYNFLKTYRPEAADEAWTFTFDSIANGTTTQIYTEEAFEDETGIEGNLDVQNLISVGWPTPLIAYTTGGSPPFDPDDETTTDSNEPYLVWLESVLAESDDDIAKVISTSYDDDEQTVPLSYATRVCNDMAQLGARGVSLFYASGDGGVGPSGACYSNDGKNTSIFLPEFPSTCPYITSVGATGNFTPEIVAYVPDEDYASGGGFSNYFARPSYQDAVVEQYIASLDGQYAQYYNQSGRAYPDIAAQGLFDIIVWDGYTFPVGGTSAATPTAAAIFALVNDALLAAGKSTIGFLNPWLYKTGYKAFTDVTIGSAVGCEGLGDGLGFPAEVGWDAVSGWGTPHSRHDRFCPD
ncbi:tripeptidyl peptidase [Cryphonectria parasitica EP155]|uniref:tripeptidyl-peptidase II n=1 Tax=Cryphonectria parasitica (strain ATCC 38755 / EP155) TaxID=660469 RepID=A0A9P4XV15_CRYP1|nr:tripeptidyl peptidase [Cryphonectria parasitica EP155]KAF3761352.1 tripeptidyl peptidase [Cryphonectria parasitica EP155]